MSYLLACLLVETSHDEAGSNFRILHDHLLDKKYDFRLQKAAIIYLKLVVVDKFKLAQPLIQANLIVPPEPHINRASTCPRHAVLQLIERTIEKTWLVTQVAAEREEH